MVEGVNCIEDFEGKFSGERVFVLGNGPSLNDTPLEKLDSEYTLGMNKISCIYSNTEWRPSFYYFAQSPGNSEAPDEYADSYLEATVDLGIPCFINSEYRGIIGGLDNVYYFDKFHLWGHNPFHQADIEQIETMPIDQLDEFWSTNICHHIYHYHTMHGALQAVAYLGFDDIILLGCDLGLEYRDPHMIFESGLDPYRFSGNISDYIREAINEGCALKSISNGIALALIQNFNNSQLLGQILDQETNNRFSKNYLSNLSIIPGDRHEAEMRKSHVAAKRICANQGVDVYNGTVGGELETYERVDIFNII